METRISDEVSELLKTLSTTNGETFDPRDKFTEAAQSIISRIVFGLPIDIEDKAENRLMELVLKWGTQFMNLLPLDFSSSLRFLPYFRKCISQTQILTDEMFSLINKKIDRCIRSGIDESFVSYFVEAQGKDFDRAQLKVTIRDLMLAGTETTSSTMMYACVLLANHPAVQERLQKEIDSVVSKDRQPSMDDMSKMTYVEATILELMRLKTVLPLGVPRATLCDTEVCGYFIPKNSHVSNQA